MSRCLPGDPDGLISSQMIRRAWSSWDLSPGLTSLPAGRDSQYLPVQAGRGWGLGRGEPPSAPRAVEGLLSFKGIGCCLLWKVFLSPRGQVAGG